MTASSNFGNVFSVLVASAFIPFLPMLPMHLLVQNLLYDISQIAIPFIQSRAAAPLMVMTGVIMVLGIFLPMGPLAHYFKLQALPLGYFPILVAILLGYMTLTQWMKGYYSRRFGWQ